MDSLQTWRCPDCTKECIFRCSNCMGGVCSWVENDPHDMSGSLYCNKKATHVCEAGIDEKKGGHEKERYCDIHWNNIGLCPHCYEDYENGKYFKNENGKWKFDQFGMHRL